MCRPAKIIPASKSARMADEGVRAWSGNVGGGCGLVFETREWGEKPRRVGEEIGACAGLGGVGVAGETARYTTLGSL